MAPMRVSENSGGPKYRPQVVGLFLQGRPLKGPPIHRKQSYSLSSDSHQAPLLEENPKSQSTPESCRALEAPEARNAKLPAFDIQSR